MTIRTDDAGMSHSVNMAIENNNCWGPILGRSAMPTLVDGDGYFFATSEALHKNNPNLREVENELAREFGYNLVVTHVGVDDAELGALLDMNTDGGLPEMSKNRQGELNALTSERFSNALKARNVKLITYRQLIDMQGLKSMRRPGGF
jgi:peroxiredoxin family protein